MADGDQTEVFQWRRGGVAGGAGCLMHLSSASGGIYGGQGENLDDDVCGRRSLLGGVFSYLTILQCVARPS